MNKTNKLWGVVSFILIAVLLFSVFQLAHQTNLKLASEKSTINADFNLMDYIYVEQLPKNTWVFPIEDYLSRGIDSDYGWRIHSIYKTARFHEGISFTGKSGEKIFAIADGTVTKAGWYGGYGLMIIIEHGKQPKIETRYGHLLRGSLKVKVGDKVTAGQTIGLMGNTGVSTGTHLHFEIRLDGKHVDPKEYMKNLTTTGGR